MTEIKPKIQKRMPKKILFNETLDEALIREYEEEKENKT